jgi:hypothetical protein
MSEFEDARRIVRDFTPSEQRFMESEIRREQGIIDRQADELARLRRYTTTRNLPVHWVYEI